MKAAALVLAAAALFLGGVLTGAWPGAGHPQPVGAIGMRDAATRAEAGLARADAAPADAAPAGAAPALAGPAGDPLAGPATVPGEPAMRTVARTVGRFDIAGDAGDTAGDAPPGRAHDGARAHGGPGQDGGRADGGGPGADTGTGGTRRPGERNGRGHDRSGPGGGWHRHDNRRHRR